MLWNLAGLILLLIGGGYCTLAAFGLYLAGVRPTLPERALWMSPGAIAAVVGLYLILFK